MNIRIFDPAGIKPEDYKFRYPEIDRAPEFANLNVRALIFTWWYANATSELVLYVPDPYERVKEALRRSGYNPTKTEKEKILSLQFDSDLAAAIKKMASFDPGARYKAYVMIKNIYDHYETLINLGPEAFKITTKVGRGEDAVETSEIDYKKYVDVSAKISEELPGLLTKMEEGFAIVDVSGAAVIEDESSSMRDWHMKKEN
jgi:hypothetical protein